MFALEPSYAADQKQPLNEFKSMVKALHQAGIEVILDVVFNHTAESEKTFPTFCQRGIDDKPITGKTSMVITLTGQAAATCSILPMMLLVNGY